MPAWAEKHTAPTSIIQFHIGIYRYILLFMFLLELCKTLDKHQVDYAIVGGYAVALHGVVRGTVDIDIILRLNQSDFEAAENSFHSMGLKSRLPVSAKEVFQFREEYISNKHLITWSFYDETNPMNVVDVIITENLDHTHTDIVHYQGMAIHIVAKEDLIRMKEKSNRLQDKEDIKALLKT